MLLGASPAMRLFDCCRLHRSLLLLRTQDGLLNSFQARVFAVYGKHTSVDLSKPSLEAAFNYPIAHKTSRINSARCRIHKKLNVESTSVSPHPSDLSSQVPDFLSSEFFWTSCSHERQNLALGFGYNATKTERCKSSSEMKSLVRYKNAIFKVPVEDNKVELRFSSEEVPGKDIEPADSEEQKFRRLEMKLRSELPYYFSKENTWHDFSIYAPTVELVVSPRMRKRSRTCRGLVAYKRVAHLFRFFCKICLRDPRLDVLSLVCHEEKKTMEVRWRVTGSPYYILIFSFLLPKSKLIRYYDYMSVLSINEDAKIWRHHVSKLRPIHSPLLNEISGIGKRLQAATAVTPFAEKRSDFSHHNFSNSPNG